MPEQQTDQTTDPQTVEPAVGQIWADNDSRSEGRTVRVDSIDATHATCTVITNSDLTQRLIVNPGGVGSYVPRDMRGKSTRLALKRMRPSSTGFRYVSGPDDA